MLCSFVKVVKDFFLFSKMLTSDKAFEFSESSGKMTWISSSLSRCFWQALYQQNRWNQAFVYITTTSLASIIPIIITSLASITPITITSFWNWSPPQSSSPPSSSPQLSSPSSSVTTTTTTTTLQENGSFSTKVEWKVLFIVQKKLKNCFVY